MEVTEILRRFDKEKIEFINLQFTDIVGEVRQVINPARDLQHILQNGLGFDGSSAKYVPVDQSDLVLKPDLKTLQILPWGRPENKTARFICDVLDKDRVTPFDADPRYILKKTIEDMRQEFGQSWDFVVAPEMEFFLLEVDEGGNYIPHDRGTYFSIPPYDKETEFRKDLSRALDSMGILCEKNHHEVPNSKHEITFRPGDALSIADATITYKQVVKFFAGEKGLIASFMPKPFDWTYGCGMHVHVNLRDRNKNLNLFYDLDSEDHFSNLARHFIAGILDHAKGLTGITNPSVNSYKRLVPGWEAPVYVAWGPTNRSVLLRIPVSDLEATRVESRNPDASCNPYLAFSAILGAGLDGIRRGLLPPPPINENIYEMSDEERRKREIENLPGNLSEALGCLKKNTVICETLGSSLMKKFLEIKEKEWREFSTHVHPWELEKYVNV
jgi:glutamine synthetase